MEYLDLARKYVEDRLGSDADEQTVDVLARWESVLDPARDRPDARARASSTGSPSCSCSSSTATATAWTGTTPSCTLIDLQYADVRPDKGLYHRLRRGWAGSTGCSTDEEVAAAMHQPPTDTRAYFRGRCLEKYADRIAAASWDSVIFDLPGRESLQRVPTIDPLRGSRAHVGRPARPL